MNRIIITEGDPSGISYELLEKSFSIIQKIAQKNQIILVRSQNQIYPKQFIQFKKYNFEKTAGIFFYEKEIFSGKINLSKPNSLSGKISYSSLITGIELQKKNGGNLITLPLSKEWVIQSGIKNFSGHTETLAKEYNQKTFMLMYSKSLKVLTLTTHIPLKKVPESLKKLEIGKLILALKKNPELILKPIGVCGLNPHAGENGKIGTEEKKILLPMIKKIEASGIKISEPISADSIFIPEISKKFGIIFACYHDQGLIPFKSIIGKRGINMTLGLDFYRVSPDHGPAFDIAGKNLCNPDSFIECLKVLS